MNTVSAPSLTVITVTWNGWQDTRRCLASVFASAAHDSATEVLVIDNASKDGTPANIEQMFPTVRVLRNTDNLGHTKAVNQGLTVANGEYVLLLDSDTELAPDAISHMLEFLERHQEVGLIAPRTYNSDGSIQLSARRFPRPLNGLFGRQSVLTRWFPNNPITRRYLQTDELASNEPYEVEQASGACMLFRRSLFTSIGPWDEGYFAYWVDSDWCFRLRTHGWKVFCVPQASVIHHEQNHRGKKKSLRRIWIFHYGAYRFYRNNMTWGMLDPRALLAAVALGAHGLAQLAHNVILPRAESNATASTTK